MFEEEEITEPNIIFKTEITPWWTRVNVYFKPLIIGIKICLILIPISFFFQAYSLLAFLILMLGALLFIILLRINGFNTYIYKIGIQEQIVLIYYTKKGEPNILKVKNQNFRIRFYRSGHGSYFIFEQHQPYKLLITQHANGYWTNEKNIEVFRPYVSKIEYNYGAYYKTKNEPIQ